jgi:hypothetical protein
MTADPTLSALPGSLPGLLRRGAPVVLGGFGVVNGRIFLGERHDLFAVTGDDDTPRLWGKALVALDLTDPAGMDIAARWLAEKVGFKLEATAPSWWKSGPCQWVLQVGGAAKTFNDRGAPTFVVPGISTLTDPRAALAAACLAVGGSNG